MLGRGPLPVSARRLFNDYDLDGLQKLVDSLGLCSLMDKMKAMRENLESFKKPNALGVYNDDEGEDDDDDNDDDDDEEEEEEDMKEEDLELISDEKKPASSEQTLLIGDEKKPASGEPVTDEGERLYKKPRLAEGFESLGEAGNA